MKNKIMNNVMYQVFGWMFLGLMITFVTGYAVSLNRELVYNIFGGVGRYILVFVTLGFGIFLGARLWKLKPGTATILFLLYALLIGLTLSTIFVTYKLDSLLLIFLVAAIIFGVFGFLGSIIKIDLTKIATFLFMALIGVIVLGIVNMFIGNSLLNTIISCVSLAVFIGYTAYDINKLKKMIENGASGRSLAIYGAFSLFLDYINIVIDLVNLFGDGRR